MASFINVENQENADPDACPTAWMHFPSLGTCIFVPPHPADWDEAEQYCRSKGAHLVSITSEHEAFIVRGVFFLEGHHAQFLTMKNQMI